MAEPAAVNIFNRPGYFLDRISEVDISQSEIRFGQDNSMLNISSADELLIVAMEKKSRFQLDTSVLNQSMLSTSTQKVENLFVKLCRTRDEIHEELSHTQSSSFGPINGVTLQCEMGFIQLLQLSAQLIMGASQEELQQEGGESEYFQKIYRKLTAMMQEES